MKKVNILYLLSLLFIYVAVAAVAFYFGTRSTEIIEENYKIVGGLLLMSSIPHLIIFVLQDGLNNKKKIPYFVFAVTGIVLGIVGMYVKAIGLTTLCLIWGIFDICRSSFEIIDVIPEIKDKKWLEILEIVASVGEIVIAVFLIMDRVEGLNLHFYFLGSVFLLYFVKYIISIFIDKKEAK